MFLRNQYNNNNNLNYNLNSNLFIYYINLTLYYLSARTFSISKKVNQKWRNH